MKKKRKLEICTYRPFAQNDTSFVLPRTTSGQLARSLGLCGLLVSTSGPTCTRPAGHDGFHS